MELLGEQQQSFGLLVTGAPKNPPTDVSPKINTIFTKFYGT